ncbi:MAG TPA: hypothetical protein HA304_04055 [Methanosarcinales archaeon]|nr:hypothetical protein [Methanosarcinales archaeon]
MVSPGRIAGLLGITIFAALVTVSASAECNWSNQIIIHPEGMEWQYTEKLSDMDSFVFKYDIDNRQGNKDQFVSTWELMKGDKQMRERFRDAIEREMDVRIDNSSLGIEVLDIDASLSKNALGPVKSMTELTNTYQVTYAFPGGLLENGSTIWFLGEPGSLLSVNFPEGTQIISTKGIDNVSIRTSYLSGRFGAINECINVTDNESLTNEDLTDESVSNECVTNESATNNEGADAEGAEITYIIDIVLPPQNNMSEELGENESTIPVPTDIPSPGIVYVLLVIAAAVLLSKD